MSITKIGTRLLSAVVPTTRAAASCGRCGPENPTTRCCRPQYRQFVAVDVCGNVCFTTCLHRPDYC